MLRHILTLFSYKLAAIKMVTPSKEHLEEHYKDLSDKPFFKGLVTCTFYAIAPTEEYISRLMGSRYAQRSHCCYGLGGTRRRQDRPRYAPIHSAFSG